MTIAAAQIGTLGEAAGRESPQLAAFSRATAWINSPRLAAADLRGRSYSSASGAWAEKYQRQLAVIGVPRQNSHWNSSPKMMIQTLLAQAETGATDRAWSTSTRPASKRRRHRRT